MGAAMKNGQKGEGRGKSICKRLTEAAAADAVVVNVDGKQKQLPLLL